MDPVTSSHFIDLACANNGAALHWVAGVLGASVAASALANLRHRMPAWVVKIVDIVALNLFKLAEEKAQQPPASPIPPLPTGGASLTETKP